MQSSDSLPPATSSTPSLALPGGRPLPDRDDIIDTLAAEQLPVFEFPWVEVLSVVAVAVVVALIVIYWRKRFRPRPAESLEARARRRIAELASHSAPDPRAFHAELAGILVRYMEASLGLPGTRLTSHEIFRAFRNNGRMSLQWQQRLEELLAECDRAKFAPVFDAEWDPAATALRGRAILDALSVQVAAAPRLASPWEGWSDAAV